jgi:hypothetical protein
MTVFTTTATPEGAAPDPTKHVRYVDGMVLGVDDFTQEFAYLSNRDWWMCRDLIGYGTVSGLAVSLESDAGAPRVVVQPGTAVTPRGEIVRVGLAQCASLKDWLAADEQVTRLNQRAAGGPLNVYVTLRYTACATDEKPIPGEPCRTEDDMLQASRFMDDFALELRLDPPAQPDEAAIRDFVEWLAEIPIVDGPSTVTPDQFVDAIRDAAYLVASPPSPGDFMYGSPPAALRIGRDDACQFLRTAYRVWVTDLRPKWAASWLGAGQRCSDARPVDQPEPEDAVLLARLDLPIVHNPTPGGAPWQIQPLDYSNAGQYIDQDSRPFLVPVRMLQEWLWCGWNRGGQAAGEVVAAGRIKVGADPVGRSKLAASTEATVNGGVLVTFADYRQPAGFDYAVLTQTTADTAIKAPRIDFVSCGADGIVLRVADGSNKAAKPADLKDFEFTVQVTRYPL